ncbi:MAG: hypothetical protein ACHQQQ_14080 [Bacteroidota bacterium]
MNKSYRKSGGGTYFIIFIILLVALFLYIRYHHRILHPVQGFPLLAEKPKPQEITFRGCPPEGEGGDPEMNKLKNRVDEGNYLPVDFDILEALPWPPEIEKKKRMLWSTDDDEEINQYEGTPVVVEGYLAGVREEGPESPNCRGLDHESRDYHMWLTKTAGYDRSNSIVVETTPRVRQKHFSWKLRFLKELSNRHEQFRISGWVMLDPDHPDQVGKTRGTIWEIHPVMKIEVKLPLGWKSLDDMVPPNGQSTTDDEDIDGE